MSIAKKLTEIEELICSLSSTMDKKAIKDLLNAIVDNTALKELEKNALFAKQTTRQYN